MKTYIGRRRPMTVEDWVRLGWDRERAEELQRTDQKMVDVVVATDDGVYPLRHYVRHSPTGFEWGYWGSGPSDLARCILIDHLGLSPEEAADPYYELGVSYQRFKEDHVAVLDRQGPWSITAAAIDEWIARIREES